MSREEEDKDIESMKSQLADSKVRLALANRHMRTLYTQVQDLEVQFKTAIKHKKHSARYNLRQKLAVIMGLKIVYLNYVSDKQKEVDTLNQKLAALSNNEAVEPMDTTEDEDPRSRLVHLLEI